MEMPRPASTGGSQQDQKKKFLQQLMQTAMGGPSKGIHDTVHAIKTAMGAYKNFSKEWDTLNGVSADAMPKSQPMQQAPKSMPMPSTPDSMPKQPMQPTTDMNMHPMPAMQPMQNSQPLRSSGNTLPPVPPKMPPILPQPQIAGPMPAFMGGGHPAGF